ncbi:MAG: PD40 domain-containing protein, partial [Planctomycetales bacterium]|nr:PD40 domain-containing protein [Planctomycetales bacterium]
MNVSSLAADEPVKPTDESPQSAPSYYHDIRPLFQAHCQGCHQPAKPQGDYVMTDFSAMLKGGESGEPAIVPEDLEASYLMTLITPEDGEAEMPQGKPPLSSTELETISRWILAGAKDDTPPSTQTPYDHDHPPQYDSLPIVTAIDYSPDGSLIAVAGYHEVLLHQPDGTEIVDRLVGLSERIESVAFSPDGKRLAVTGGQPARMGEVQIWDVESRELELSIPVTYDSVYGASWSPDGKLVAFGCTDNSIRAIDAESGKQVVLQRAPNDWTLATVFSVDGSHLVSTGRDMAVKLVHVETERFVDNITSITPGALKGGLFALARHPQRDEVLVGGDDGVPRAFRMFRQTDRKIGDNSNLIRNFPGMPGRIFDVAYSPDGKTIAASSSLDGKGYVYIFTADYDIELPDEIKKIEAKVVSSRNDQEKQMLEDFRKQGVAILTKLPEQQGGVYSITFSPDGSALASAGYDGQIRVYECQTGQ